MLPDHRQQRVKDFASILLPKLETLRPVRFPATRPTVHAAPVRSCYAPGISATGMLIVLWSWVVYMSHQVLIRTMPVKKIYKKVIPAAPAGTGTAPGRCARLSGLPPVGFWQYW